jgi:L-erythro-3,5-diaminohexanoate dehydrogenase
MVKRMPEDFSEGVALAAMDICGAPAQVKRLIHPRDKVLVVGLGKAGRSVVVQASQMGASVFGLDESEEAVVWCQKNVEGHFNRISASHVQDVHGWAAEETGKKLMDVTVSATSAPNTEMAAILPCREGGKALFFGMQTSFQKVVLGAEGVGKDIQLLMGSGYVPGHADLMFNLLRNHKPLRRWFEDKFG